MNLDDRWVALLLPSEIRDLTQEQLIQKIREIKTRQGERLAILAHHYQKDEIVALADHKGDSLALARLTLKLKKTEFIVFCGVEFMVETAAILSRPEQKLISPAPNAGCPLADMASAEDVLAAWEEMAKIVNIKKVIPIAYINSSSEIKAFCGEREGIICTSSNAGKAIKWALGKGERVLFLPDENLGRNTCNALRIPREKTAVWNPELPGGGCERDELKAATVILWKGFCNIHTEFTSQQIRMARENYPGCNIIVHPECQEEVVNVADAVGSTSYIITYVEEALPGSVIVIGTEINLIRRLAKEHPDKTIVELSVSECPDMARVNLRNLYWVLQNLGEVNVIKVDDRIKKSARHALDRMLAIK